MLCRVPSWLLCLGSSSLVDEQPSVDVQVISEGTTLVTPPCRQAPMSAKLTKSDPLPVNDRVHHAETPVPSKNSIALPKQIEDPITTEVIAVVKKTEEAILRHIEDTVVAEQSTPLAKISQGKVSSAHVEPERPIDPAHVPLPPSIASDPSIASEPSTPSDSSDSSILSDSSIPSASSTPEQTDPVAAPSMSRLEEAIDKAALIKHETRIAASVMHDLGFRQIRVLGAGGCGVALAGLVFVPARRAFTGVVVKRTFGAGAEVNFKEEVEFLAACQGQGVVELWGTDPRHRLMSMEQLDYSLHDAIGRGWRSGPYEDHYVLAIDPHQLAGQLLAAIEHVHAKGVIHRDIKPGNVLLRRERDGRTIAKLADFGLACWSTSKTRSLVGTPGFYAPEQLVSWRSGHCRYDEKVDLWCFGATLFELLVGRQLVDPYRSHPLEELDTLVDLIDVDHAAWLRRAPEQWPSLDAKQMTRILACTPDRSLQSLLHRSLQWGPEERFGAWELLTKLRSMHRPMQRPRPGHGGYRSVAPGGQRVLHN